MAAEEHKAVIRRLVEELNKGNDKIMDELYSNSFVGHPPASMGLGTLDFRARVQLYHMFKQAFPDFTHVAEDLVAEGDKVVSRMTISARAQVKR